MVKGYCDRQCWRWRSAASTLRAAVGVGGPVSMTSAMRSLSVSASDHFGSTKFDTHSCSYVNLLRGDSGRLHDDCLLGVTCIYPKDEGVPVHVPGTPSLP